MKTSVLFSTLKTGNECIMLRRVSTLKNGKPVKKEFDAVAATVDNWHNEVFAYFNHQYTNALTEAVNGLIKQINRAGRGYKFENIRAKALNMKIGDRNKPRPLRDAKAPPAETFECENCHGLFPVVMRERHHVTPLAAFIEAGVPAQTMTVCPDCHRRFHTLGVEYGITH